MRFTPSTQLIGLIPILIFLCATTNPHRAEAGNPFVPDDLPDLVERIIPSVVFISTKIQPRTQIQSFGWGDYFQFFGIPEEQRAGSLGSGFLIDHEGYLLTNFHVIEQAVTSTNAELQITLKDQRQFMARVVGRDAKTDLALLQIRDKSGKVPINLTPAKLGDSQKVRIAEPVVAIGNPFGLDYSVTAGIISSKNRNIGQGPFDNFLQTDAAINPGNSGGPLYNTKGEVMGINTAIYSKTGQSAGISFAIPINEAKAVLADLKKFGRVPRPWIGILSRRVTPQLAYMYGLQRDAGVLVLNLIEGAPADSGGLTTGDIIFELNGKKVSEQVELERALSELKPTDRAAISVLRGNRVLKKNIRLEEFPPNVNRVREGIL